MMEPNTVTAPAHTRVAPRTPSGLVVGDEREPDVELSSSSALSLQATEQQTARVLKQLVDPRILSARFIPVEQRSRLVRLAGAGDFREAAKDLAFLDTDEALASRRSKRQENAYCTPIMTIESMLRRELKLAQAERSFESVPTGKKSSLFFADLPITNLPPELEGFQIYFDSDIHFREKKTGPIEEVEATTRFMKDNGIVPGFCGLGGDLTTKRPTDLTKKALQALEQIPFGHARGAVLGNHDYYGQGRDYVAFDLAKYGYPDLTDGHLQIKIGEATMNIYGVDDHLEGRPKAPDISAAKADEVNIVIVHNLDAVQTNFPHSIDAILSGHTHWGEVDFGILNGSEIMRACGYLDMLNGHSQGFEALTDRAISYITPGHGSHFFRYRTSMPGGTLLTLRSAAEPSPEQIAKRIQLAA